MASLLYNTTSIALHQTKVPTGMPISMSTFVEFHVNIQTITRHKATLSVYSVGRQINQNPLVRRLIVFFFHTRLTISVIQTKHMPDMTEVIGMSPAVGNYYSRFLFLFGIFQRANRLR